MRRPFLGRFLVVTCFAACTPHAFTPPARTFVMDTPALATGKSDAQFDVSTIGTLWGPDLSSGNGRYRHAIAPDTIVEAEGGILHVNNDGDGGDRNAYTGRLGGIWRTEDQRWAATGGLGGGTSAVAGSWYAADLGVMTTGRHKTFRPVLAADVGYSAPFDRGHTFSVNEPDHTPRELQLPRNITLKMNAGVELGDEVVSVLVGLTFIKFYQLDPSVVGENDTDDDLFVAIGAGLRLGLD
jgi:hypothetical protein